MDLVLRLGLAQEEAIRRERVWPGAAAVGLWAVVSLALILITGTSSLREQFPELPPGTFSEIKSVVLYFALLSAAAGPFVWVGGISALMHLAARPFGGGGSFRAMLAGVGVSCAPWAIAGAVQLLLAGLEAVIGFSAILGIIGLAVSVAALAWHIVLVVRGGALVAGIGYGPATGSCALSAFGCATAGLFLVTTLAVLAVALSR